MFTLQNSAEESQERSILLKRARQRRCMKDLEGRILINFVNVFPGIYFLDIHRFAGTDKISKNFYQVIRYSCLILDEK
jgi:hypothetical protein